MTMFTVKMAAERLGFKSTDTIYAMINNGELGCIRRPNCAIRIKEEHILSYEAKFECPAQSDQKQNTNSLKSTGAGTGTSASVNRAAAAAKSKVRASHLRTV